MNSLQTTFINTIDAPSLALLVPIVHRGLRERSAETKKKAAQIVGNMCSLVTEPKDMIPYIGLLLPEVKKVPFCKSGNLTLLFNYFLIICAPKTRFLWIQFQKLGQLQQGPLDPLYGEWAKIISQILFHGCLIHLNLIIVMLSALELLKGWVRSVLLYKIKNYGSILS